MILETLNLLVKKREIKHRKVLHLDVEFLYWDVNNWVLSSDGDVCTYVSSSFRTQLYSNANEDLSRSISTDEQDCLVTIFKFNCLYNVFVCFVVMTNDENRIF
jgi:hypothetical protein